MVYHELNSYEDFISHDILDPVNSTKLKDAGEDVDEDIMYINDSLVLTVTSKLQAVTQFLQHYSTDCDQEIYLMQQRRSERQMDIIEQKDTAAASMSQEQ